MKDFECWKCGEWFQSHQGKITKLGTAITCYSCLREWNSNMKAVWRAERLREEIEERKKPINQMDIFESVDTLQSVFH